MPISSNPARIAWHTKYESLGQWETLTAKLLADKTYMEIAQSTLHLPSPNAAAGPHLAEQLSTIVTAAEKHA